MLGLLCWLVRSFLKRDAVEEGGVDSKEAEETEQAECQRFQTGTLVRLKPDMPEEWLLDAVAWSVAMSTLRLHFRRSIEQPNDGPWAISHVHPRFTWSGGYRLDNDSLSFRGIPGSVSDVYFERISD